MYDSAWAFEAVADNSIKTVTYCRYNWGFVTMNDMAE